MGAGTVGHVVVDGHGERVGLLEDHADVAAQLGHIPAGGVDLLSPIGERAGNFYTLDQVVHPVDGAEKRGFPAAGRADEGRDVVCWNVQGDAFQGVGLPVIEVQVLCR